MKQRVYIKILLFSFLITLLPPAFPQNNNSKLILNFNNLRGNWGLSYDSSYGYSFRFGKNYRALVIVYFNNSSIIFKGIYNIEDADTIRINISEMKREEKVHNLNLRTGFVRVKSSYFIFKSKISESGKTRKLELTPEAISINGGDSEGYFEPVIELYYTGK